MVKEMPASMTRVVLAFVGTFVVAVAPLLTLLSVYSDLMGEMVSALTRYAASGAWVALTVLAVVATSMTVKTLLRRRPSVFSA